MKFYIATKFQNKKRFDEVKAQMEAQGHTITYDWSNAKVNDIDQAMRDVLGVKEADIVIGIFEDEYVYKGAIAEIGMAMAWGKSIFILGDWLDNMIFMKLANLHKIKSVTQITNFTDFSHWNKED